MACVDGNEAAARVAYRLSEVIALYPITPASPMGEHSDDWAAAGVGNLWGQVPEVVEMQSEAGAAGALHGALQKGSLATTFTASQGLLLMVPNMFKIAGELSPAVIHVAARTVATHALSIFGDHSDVMHARSTGWAMLAAGSVQEAHDFALVAHAATLRSRVPFLHFFDGFRTSHQIDKISTLSDDDLRALVREDDIVALRARGMTPDHPVVRGTAQNPDVFFQAREAANPFHAAVPEIVATVMGELGERTGRHYGLVDYTGAPDAERVVVLMGSGAGAVQETVEALVAAGEKVGLVRVRLFQPFPTEAFVAALPPTVRSIAVLDRTKEPGAVGEPLYLAVVATLAEHLDDETPMFDQRPRVIGGRYGLSSKELTPAMIKPIFDELATPRPKRHFTVGIVDDVTHLSLAVDDDFTPHRPTGEVQALFFGLGSDGTVGANKASIKIIGENTDRFVQGYFVYDSKKSGSVTVSHLRFGPEPIRSTYLIDRADFVACHQFGLLETVKVLEHARPGATLLLNTRFGPDQVWDQLPGTVQRQIIDKAIEVWVIDASARGPRDGDGRPHQHRDAALLLPALRRARRRRGHHRDQAVGGDGLRRPGTGPRRAQLRRHRPVDRRAPPRRHPRHGHQRAGRWPSPSPTTPPPSSSRSPPCSWPATATGCRSARSRPTAPSPPARPATRSGPSPPRSRSGIPTSASTAACAPSCAPTPPSA